MRWPRLDLSACRLGSRFETSPDRAASRRRRHWRPDRSRAAESQANAQESLAKAQKTTVEAQMMPEELRVKTVQALTNNLDSSNNEEFNRRARVADLILKEREIQTKENIVEAQMNKKVQ